MNLPIDNSESCVSKIRQYTNGDIYDYETYYYDMIKTKLTKRNFNNLLNKIGHLSKIDKINTLKSLNDIDVQLLELLLNDFNDKKHNTSTDITTHSIDVDNVIIA